MPAEYKPELYEPTISEELQKILFYLMVSGISGFIVGFVVAVIFF